MISKTNQYFGINIPNNSEFNIDMNASHNNMQKMENINSQHSDLVNFETWKPKE